MKIIRNFIKVAATLVAIFCFNACADDINTIGSSLLDNDNFDALLFDDVEMQSTQVSFSKVQTNNLPGYLLGVYNDQVFGQTTANVLTQLTLQNSSPNFGDNVVLDSVILTLPYFSTTDDTTVPIEDQNFDLDSVYGNQPIRLTVSRSNYFLRDLDPNSGSGFEDPQRYFSDQKDDIESNLGQEFFTLESYMPSPTPVDLFTRDEETGVVTDTTFVSPRLRVKLDNLFWLNNIINKADDEELASQNNFEDFFRGLYFQVEALSQEGNMTFFNFNSGDANITLHYTSDSSNTDDSGDGTTGTENNTFRLSFTGTKVNVFSNPSTLTFDDTNLYLKGMEGHMAELNIFSSTEQLDSIRDLGWLINEANLTFFVNQELAETGETEPERIFIYDLDNGGVLIDYVLDPITLELDVVNSKLTHLGRLEREPNSTGSISDETQSGVSYKIRMTQYVNDIINNDSTNVRLGVYVSSNVNISSSLDGFKASSDDACEVLTSSIINPEGTVLHGINSPDEDKKLKLRIFYSEPNQ